jgi:hypothetical protein
MQLAAIRQEVSPTNKASPTNKVSPPGQRNS